MAAAQRRAGLGKARRYLGELEVGFLDLAVSGIDRKVDQRACIVRDLVPNDLIDGFDCCEDREVSTSEREKSARDATYARSPWR